MILALPYFFRQMTKVQCDCPIVFFTHSTSFWNGVVPKLIKPVTTYYISFQVKVYDASRYIWIWSKQAHSVTDGVAVKSNLCLRLKQTNKQQQQQQRSTNASPYPKMLPQ